MAVSGLPVPRPDHAEAMAVMAIGMQEAFRGVMRSRGLALELRIGIHSGPVAAGVIGRQKFTYDLWGDTVRLARGIVSDGETSIQVTKPVRDRVQDLITFGPAVATEIKGMGRIELYPLIEAGTSRKTAKRDEGA